MQPVANPAEPDKILEGNASQRSDEPILAALLIGNTPLHADEPDAAVTQTERPQEVSNPLLDALPSDENLLGEANIPAPLDLEPAPVDFWQELRLGFTLDHNIDHRRLTVQRNWYAKHQSYLDRVLTRGEPYLFHIYSEVKRRGLPNELVLLPIVESAFDPFAYSHGRASGIWQFIPGTGRMFGLKQTWWYDGRRDIVAATDAALEYLEALNKQFDGNWLHALAAYNSGGGNVRKAIRYNNCLLYTSPSPRDV